MFSYSHIIRGIGRIFKGGVQFAEILLTTPTLLKKTTPIIHKLRGTALNI